MLDLKFVRGNIDKIQQMVVSRNMDLDVGEFVRLDEERRRLLGEVETLKAQRNQVNQQITELKKSKQDASGLIDQVKGCSTSIKELDPLTSQADQAVHDFLLTIPNMPHESVPVGKSEEDNPEVKRWGEPPEFDFEPLNHWDIGENLGIMDFATAAKITGSRFVLLKGAASRLERTLTNYMLDLHTLKHGYTEVLPPFMCNAESMTGTGQLPKFEDDLFKLEGWKLLLGAHGRGAGDQHPSGRDHTRGPSAHSLHGVHPLFSRRSRVPWQGHPGHDPAAPVLTRLSWSSLPVPRILLTNLKNCWPTRKPSSRG